MLCPQCGSLGTGKFCVQCGATLVAPTVTGATDAPARSLAVEIDEANAAAAAAPTITRDGKARQQAAAYLKLQPSEQAVVAAASRIFAAYVQTSQVTDANEVDMVNRAVRAAVRLAMVTERVVQADDEDW